MTIDDALKHIDLTERAAWWDIHDPSKYRLAENDLFDDGVSVDLENPYGSRSVFFKAEDGNTLDIYGVVLEKAVGVYDTTCDIFENGEPVFYRDSMNFVRGKCTTIRAARDYLKERYADAEMIRVDEPDPNDFKSIRNYPSACPPEAIEEASVRAAVNRMYKSVDDWNRREADCRSKSESKRALLDINGIRETGSDDFEY